MIGRAVSRLLGLVPPGLSHRLVDRLISWYVIGKKPDEALRFLFRLDERLYDLQGLMAVNYGGGVHPKHRLMKYHDFFVDQIQKGEKVLDIGCGIGAVAFDIAEKAGATVLGMDLNAANIETAKEKYSHPLVEYRVGDALKELPAGRFNVVVLSNVLEHLPGRDTFLRAICDKLVPERLLIRVPLFERDWRVPLKKELGVEWRLDPTHETEYTLESFHEEIRNAGLQIHSLQVCWGEIWAVVKAGDS